MQIRYGSTLALTLIALPMVAQQAGTIVGTTTQKDGQGLSGVRIEAASKLLPQPRRVVSGKNGEYRLAFLPPGTYVLTFTHPGMATAKRGVSVALQRSTTVNVGMVPIATQSAIVEVVASASLVDTTSAELKTSIGSEIIGSLPVGQDYRDLIKLIPGVQYSQDAVRGPSAGGSGQDNVHRFDGVNVNMPFYGTMSAEPSSHDIDQIAIIKGGAAATDFNRSAGYTINSVSKSGTNTYQGELSYQLLPTNLVAHRTAASTVRYEEERSYQIANVGGPIVREKLFFFASIYRPSTERKNSSNLYGAVPDFKSTRNEFFGKLTYAPSPSLLIHASFRTSARDYRALGVVGSGYAPSTRTGGKVTMDIGILEASWLLTPSSFLNFKFTSFANKNLDRPDSLSTARPALDGSVVLNVNALDTQGLFQVPLPAAANLTGAGPYNAFIAPLVTKYGYLDPVSGAPTGGGFVGGAPQFNNQDFYRKNFQVAYDATFGVGITHEFHAGFQWWKDSENLLRISNGWGLVFAPRALTFNGQPVFFQAQVQQQGILGVPAIHSEFISENLELNDKIRWKNFTFNVGVMISNDKLYGQGLRENPGTISGYELAKGNKYLMHEIKPKDTIQPRLGVTWAYHHEDTVYANYAQYVPTASSLPRAASWARNSAATINAYFDAAGVLIGTSPEASSTGKLFAANLKPRTTDEYLLGTTKDFGSGWTGRVHARYRYSDNFWEDSVNDARVNLNPPPGIPRELYIPNLAAKMAELGGGTNSSFVIAHLDNSFTKYYEAGLEAEWRYGPAYFRGSYVWSHYYGNFDQDNTTTTATNDSNIFIGSSYIGDDAGRQLWNYKYGNLSGDRRHQVKLYGYYAFPWQGRVGAFAIYQSGQPWQLQSYEPYLALTTSRSDTNRYSEPAGSHVTPPHYQLDLNYTQTFLKRKMVTLEGMLDVFNVFNRQTGYNIQSSVHTALAGTPQTFFAPRRVQLGLRLLF